MEVLKDGRALLVRRRDETLEWEGRQLTDYEDFQPRRAGIIDAFLHDPLRTPDERGRNEDRRRCSQRGAGFKDDSTRQDAAILNVMRACESAVELANILTRARKLGVPKGMKGRFALLSGAGLITAELSARLQRRIGFRNIAVHHYQELDLDIIESEIRSGVDDVLTFAETVRPHLPARA